MNNISLINQLKKESEGFRNLIDNISCYGLNEEIIEKILHSNSKIDERLFNEKCNPDNELNLIIHEFNDNSYTMNPTSNIKGIYLWTIDEWINKTNQLDHEYDPDYDENIVFLSYLDEDVNDSWTRFKKREIK